MDQSTAEIAIKVDENADSEKITMENNDDIIKNDIIESTEPNLEQTNDANVTLTDDEKIASENLAELSKNVETTNLPSPNLPAGKKKPIMFYIE